jgi:AcrR family transcriptional regulator
MGNPITRKEGNLVTVSWQEPTGPPADRIIAVVTAMLDSGGCDCVQVADVAMTARVSLRTVYKTFGSREELILAALEAWMDAEVYQKLDRPAPGQSLREALTSHFRQVFEPWERHPQMARAFVQARLWPGGDRLLAQGVKATEAIAGLTFKDLDPDRAADIGVVFLNLAYGLCFRFAAGEIPVHEMRKTFERAVRLLA